MRSLLRERRALLILDDVWDHNHVGGFLQPDAPGCRLLITTRRATLGADLKLRQKQTVQLSKLTEEEGLALISGRLGLKPGDPNPHVDTCRAVVHLLGGHTQAIALAAARLDPQRDGPDYAPALLKRLQDQQAGPSLFDELRLEGEDRERDLDYVLRLSYHDLSDDLKRRFRALGVFAEEGSFDESAAAAVWDDAEIGPAHDALIELVSLSLVEKAGAGRYCLHSLLHAYAFALLCSANEDVEARARHLAHYRAQADYWAEKLDVTLLEADLEQYRHAFRWACDQAPESLVDLVIAAWQFLLLGNYHKDLREWLETALPVAVAQKDLRRQAHILYALGQLALLAADHQAAKDSFNRALSLYQQLEDHPGQAHTLYALGQSALLTADHQAAKDSLKQALSLYRQIEDRRGLATTLLLLGQLALITNDHQAAKDFLTSALPLFEQATDRQGQATTLLLLGQLALLMNDRQTAEDFFTSALPLYQQIEDPSIQVDLADILRFLGEINQDKGNLAAAESLFQQAADLYHALQSARNEALIKSLLARLRLQQRQPKEAIRLIWEALQYFDFADQQTPFTVSFDPLGQGAVFIPSPSGGMQRQLSSDLQATRLILLSLIERIPRFDVLWQKVTGQPLPNGLLRYLLKLWLELLTIDWNVSLYFLKGLKGAILSDPAMTLLEEHLREVDDSPYYRLFWQETQAFLRRCRRIPLIGITLANIIHKRRPFLLVFIWLEQGDKYDLRRFLERHQAYLLTDAAEAVLAELIEIDQSPFDQSFLEMCLTLLRRSRQVGIAQAYTEREEG